LNNLTLIGIGIIVFWILAAGYYFYVSRQQGDLSKEIENLREMLGEEPDED
jgi:hypothetical protein